MGVWSTSSTRLIEFQPVMVAQPSIGTSCFCARCARVGRISSRLRFASNTSRARDDFPDPDTPVTTLSLPMGMRASTLRRLCSEAPVTWMKAAPAATGRRCERECVYGDARLRPVAELPSSASCFAVPSATT